MPEGTQDTVSLDVPREFGPRSAAGWFESFLRARDASDIRLTLPSDAELSPSGIVLLASAWAARHRRGLSTRMVSSAEAEPLRQLTEIGFFDGALGTDISERPA